MLGCGVSWSVPVYDEDPHLLTYFMCVPASRQPVTEIPYTNIHSCLRKVGFRTLFVACTPTSTLRFCVLRPPVPKCPCARSKPEVLGKVVVSFVAVLGHDGHVPSTMCCCRGCRNFILHPMYLPTALEEIRFTLEISATLLRQRNTCALRWPGKPRGSVHSRPSSTSHGGDCLPPRGDGWQIIQLSSRSGRNMV